MWDNWNNLDSDDEMSVWSDDDCPNVRFHMLDCESPTETEIVCMVANRGESMPKGGARYDSESFLMIIDN